MPLILQECSDYPAAQTLITRHHHRFKSKQVATFGVYRHFYPMHIGAAECFYACEIFDQMGLIDKRFVEFKEMHIAMH